MRNLSLSRLYTVLVTLCMVLSGGWAAAPVHAATCEAPEVVVPGIFRPKDGATNLSGVIRIDWGVGNLPAGYGYYQAYVDIRNAADPPTGPYIERISALQMGSQQAYALWDSRSTMYALQGQYRLTVTFTLTHSDGSTHCPYTAEIVVGINNPAHTRHASAQELQQGRLRDAVPTCSSTSPLTGAESFTVPITSWDFKGASYGFALTYRSANLSDPQSPEEPNFAGLSQHNSKWSHNYAQWIDLYQDELGKEYAVWHRGSESLAFDKGATSFNSPEYGYSLTYDGSSPIYSPQFPCRGTYSQYLTPYSSFTITDPEGTKYEFNVQPGPGQRHLLWRTGECMIVPYYLLTRIRDRHGRLTLLTWSNETDPHVTRVWTTSRDGGGMGVVLSYTNGLLNAVVDPQGRRHSVGYLAVESETTGLSYNKLTSVTVQGPGSPNRTQDSWSFVYRDDADKNAAYGGTYTGDAIIRKTEPDGMVINYAYEAVNLGAAPWLRPRSDDWAARVSQMSWADSEGAGGFRTISRTPISASQARLAFPSGSVLYTYNGSDVASVKDENTQRTWQFTWQQHSLRTLRTPIEASGTALLENTYPVIDSNGRIDEMNTFLLAPQPAGTDRIQTLFNDYNQPATITAFARSGTGHINQVTQLEYDSNGPLTLGNLTRVIEDARTGGANLATLLFYDFPDGAWGLPTRIQNSVGGVTTLDYHNDAGRPVLFASPENLSVPYGHEDRNPSTTTIAYNLDGLPAQVKDPMGRIVQVSYTAALDPRLLVVTLTFPDGSSRRTVLDPKGRTLEARDEAGVLTRWTYTPSGAVKTVREAVGTAEERLTTFSYDTRGLLSMIDPPLSGTGDAITYGYKQYILQGSVPVETGLDESQVTKITYGGGTEYFGYNSAGELAWRVKRDGSRVNLQRDEQHRVRQIDYPANSPNPAFSVVYSYDEFGRLSSMQDPTGTTTLGYDDLNRITSVTPPGAQHPLTYSYTPDTSGHRWITTVVASMVGTYTYSEDAKGRLSLLQNPYGHAYGFEYDAAGKNRLVTYPTGVKEERYYNLRNVRDWLDRIILRRNTGAIADQYDYYYTDVNGVYDPMGRIQREIDGAGQIHSFFYDNLSQLIGETYPPDFASIAYQYDGLGNRIKKTTNGTIVDWYGFEGGGHRLKWVNRGVNTQPPAGDANPHTLFTNDTVGRVTQRERRFDDGSLRIDNCSWDGDDRLRTITRNASNLLTAAYNGDGLRISKTDAAGNHDFTWGPGGVLSDSNNGTVYTPGLAQRTTSAGDRFFHHDWLGTTRYTSNSTGIDLPAALHYDAFGNRTATGGVDPYHSTDFGFAGGWGYQEEYATATDPGVGLQYLEQRYYDPAIGRFISPDPIGLDGGVNLYAYAGNNPVMEADPDGENPLFVAAAFLGAIAFWLLASESPADIPDPCYVHVPIVTQGPFAMLGPVPRAGGAVGTAYRFGKNVRGARNVVATLLKKRDQATKSDSLPNFDAARRQAFERAGMKDPSKVKFKKVDPKTGTVVEFEGPDGAKVVYDGPHTEPGPGHDRPHVGWQTGGKRRFGGVSRGNIPYSGPQHPSRSPVKGEGLLEDN